MRWSAKIGRFAGVDVYVHFTFLLLLTWFGYSYWVATETIAGVLTGLSLIVLLFVCVTLHEYGHALTARRYGIRTQYITLLPIGGIAMLEAMPTNPKHEIVVALAGPAVNVVIAAFLFFLLETLDNQGSIIDLMPGSGSVLSTLLSANLILAVFNMLPAFPMDGGRVLRAVLSLKYERVKATRITARVARGLALLLGFLGLTGNPFLILIGIFVWIGAGAEAKAVAAAPRSFSKPVGQAMIVNIQTLAPNDRLEHALGLMLAGSQQDFPVVDGSNVVGILSPPNIEQGLQETGPQGLVKTAMSNPFIFDESVPIYAVLEQFRENGTSVACITRKGTLVGLTSLNSISHFLRDQELHNEK